MLQTVIIFLVVSFSTNVNAQIVNAHKTSGLDKIFEQQLIISEQAENRIIIANVRTREITWDWRPAESGIRAQDIEWFKAPSDAKPVYGNKYILLTASLGGVALGRMEDKKAVFYAYTGGNTHSAELLPDGNIVTASSHGNYLMVFATDTLQKSAEIYSKKIYLQDAHNVVWDKKRNVLWLAGKYKLYSLKYNFDCEHPDLTILDSIALPDSGAHDLFPMYGKDSLWLSTAQGVFKIAPSTKKKFGLREIILKI